MGPLCSFSTVRAMLPTELPGKHPLALLPPEVLRPLPPSSQSHLHAQFLSLHSVPLPLLTRTIANAIEPFVVTASYLRAVPK